MSALFALAFPLRLAVWLREAVCFTPSTFPFTRALKGRWPMVPSNSRTNQLLAKLWQEYRSRGATRFQISRRALLRSSAGGAVVSAVGIGGLLELLANREAIAAGMVIPIVGVTREPFMTPEETPHRHTFSVRFRVIDVSETAIMGTVVGRTQAVISTSAVKEDQHFHLIPSQSVSLEQLVLSGPENNEAGEHMHELSIE